MPIVTLPETVREAISIVRSLWEMLESQVVSPSLWRKYFPREVKLSSQEAIDLLQYALLDLNDTKELFNIPL